MEIFMGFLKSVARCFVALCNIFSRMLCFLHRKRNRKNSSSLLPLHNASKSRPNEIQLPVPTNDVELESWEVWEPDGRLTNQSSKFQNHFQNNMMNKRETEVADVDYFQELKLEPEIRKTKKILIRKKDEQLSSTNRLAMMTDIPLNTDLGILEDVDYGGWSEETVEDISSDAIKDKRRMDREKKLQEHQQKKMERDLLRNKKERAFVIGKLL